MKRTEIEKLRIEADVKPIGIDFKRAVREKLNPWTDIPIPSYADEANFDMFTRFFAVAGAGNISTDAMSFLIPTCEALVKNGFKLRSPANEKDVFGFTAYNSVGEKKVVYKTNDKFGLKEANEYMENKRPSYDAQAIAAGAFDMEAVLFKLKPFSNVSKKKEEIENSNMSIMEKTAAKMALFASESEVEDGYRKHSQLEAYKRSMDAIQAHLVFGTKCLEPIKFLILASPDDASCLKEVHANESKKFEETSKYAKLIIGICEFHEIPIFNVNSQKGRDGLTKLLETDFNVKM